MSQEPGPCNGEDPRLSSKGRTVGVGKAVFSSQGSSSIVRSENGSCCEIIAYFCWRKKEKNIRFNIICLKLYQFEENYLVLFVCPRICFGMCLVGENIKKNQGLPEFALGLLEVGVMKIPGDHGTLSIVYHVDLSSMESSLGLSAFTFECEVNLDGLRPFDQ